MASSRRDWDLKSVRKIIEHHWACLTQPLLFRPDYKSMLAQVGNFHMVVDAGAFRVLVREDHTAGVVFCRNLRSLRERLSLENALVKRHATTISLGGFIITPTVALCGGPYGLIGLGAGFVFFLLALYGDTNPLPREEVIKALDSLLGRLQTSLEEDE